MLSLRLGQRDLEPDHRLQFGFRRQQDGHFIVAEKAAEHWMIEGGDCHQMSKKTVSRSPCRWMSKL